MRSWRKKDEMDQNISKTDIHLKKGDVPVWWDLRELFLFGFYLTILQLILIPSSLSRCIHTKRKENICVISLKKFSPHPILLKIWQY